MLLHLVIIKLKCSVLDCVLTDRDVVCSRDVSVSTVRYKVLTIIYILLASELQLTVSPYIFHRILSSDRVPLKG